MAKLKRELEAQLKKMRLSLASAFVVIFALGLVATLGVVTAYSNNASEGAPKVVVEGDYIEATQPEPVQETNQNLGAVVSPLLPGPEFGVGNLMEYVVNADFIDASTTIFAAHSPFLAATSSASDAVVLTDGRVGYTVATTSVDLLALDITGAAGVAHTVYCGSSHNRYATTTGAITFIEATAVSSTPYLENNISAANSDGGYLTGTVDKIFLTPQRPWLICKVNSATAARFTATDNTFEGKGAFRARKLR